MTLPPGPQAETTQASLWGGGLDGDPGRCTQLFRSLLLKNWKYPPPFPFPRFSQRICSYSQLPIHLSFCLSTQPTDSLSSSF